MRPRSEVDRVLLLAASGLNDCQISRRTGIPRTTVRSWRHGRTPKRGLARQGGSCLRCAGYRFPIPGATDHAYAYLLGLYLGDGHISHHARGVFRLRITLDRAYPLIVAEAAAAIGIAMPSSKVAVAHRKWTNVDEPGSYSRHWPCLFPQHGPGKKHERPIVLEDWQRAILDRRPWRFLRGLIQSDGCRGLNTIRHPKKTYAYPRYQFSNRSDDIRDLFCEYCDKVGVEWRQMNRWNISVAKRDSVGLMDQYIGPKR
jgi:hypothetical protein